MRGKISTCPHPKKLKFNTEAEATAKADWLGLEVYECVCGKWHMTGQCTTGCPVCGAPIDDYTSCGCYEEIHYGRD